MVLRLLALALGTTTIKLSDAVAVLVAAVAFAPAGASALQDRAEDVRASRARRFQAMVSNDVEAMASYLADDLTYTHTGGDTETKTQFLETLRTGRLRYEDIEPTDVAVRVYEDVAVVTGRSKMRVRSARQTETFDIKFVEVDRRSTGRWLMVAWQATRLPPPAGASDAAGGPAPGRQGGEDRSPGVFRPGNGVTTPRPLYQLRPSYRPDALRAKIEGTVVIECVVRPDGSVTDVRVVQSLDAKFGLDDEAINAVKQWRFAPGTRDGQPVPVLVRIEMAFSLAKPNQ